MRIFNSCLTELCKNVPGLWLSSCKLYGSAPACPRFGKERPFLAFLVVQRDCWCSPSVQLMLNELTKRTTTVYILHHWPYNRECFARDRAPFGWRGLIPWALGGEWELPSAALNHVAAETPHEQAGAAFCNLRMSWGGRCVCASGERPPQNAFAECHLRFVFAVSSSLVNL